MMMRIAVLAICIVVLSVSVACAASGPATGVGWVPGSYVNPDSLVIGAQVYLWDYAHIGYDPTESRYPYDTWDDSTTWINSWFRRDVDVNGWDGPSGWYHDQALPTPSPGSSIVVKNLYVWAGQSFAYDTFKIGYMDAGFAYPEEWVRTLRLVSTPDGINYTGPREWTIPLCADKVAGTFLPNAVLPAYRTDNPLSGYEFEIEIQHVVPEPSSILALVGGIAGLGGFVLRRRKA